MKLLNACGRRKGCTQTHIGFRDFEDVLFMYVWNSEEDSHGRSMKLSAWPPSRPPSLDGYGWDQADNVSVLYFTLNCFKRSAFWRHCNLSSCTDTQASQHLYHNRCWEIWAFLCSGVSQARLFHGEEKSFAVAVGTHTYTHNEMKSTKVQTLGELRMCGTANWWAGLLACVYLRSPTSSSQRVWNLATVIDSMRESIHAIRCHFLCLQDTQQADPVVVTLC